jgi:hypothetical protein
MADLQDLFLRLEDRCCSNYVRLLGLSMISATARSLSSQHASWGHIADNVRPREMKYQDVRTASTRWLKRSRAFLNQVTESKQENLAVSPAATIIPRDWSKPTQPGPQDADLLVTSPPMQMRSTTPWRSGCRFTFLVTTTMQFFHLWLVRSERGANASSLTVESTGRSSYVMRSKTK